MYRQVKLKKRALKVALVLGLLAGLNANAASPDEEWLILPTSTPKLTFSIDKASVVREGARVTFWEKITFEQSEIKDEASGLAIKEKKMKRVMDCAGHSQGLISGATFGANGRFITSVEFSPAQIHMTDIPTGTLAAQEFDIVCGTDSKK